MRAQALRLKALRMKVRFSPRVSATLLFLGCFLRRAAQNNHAPLLCCRLSNPQLLWPASQRTQLLQRSGVLLLQRPQYQLLRLPRLPCRVKSR